MQLPYKQSLRNGKEMFHLPVRITKIKLRWRGFEAWGVYMIFFSIDKVCLYVLDKGYTVTHYASSQMQWKLHPAVVKYSDIVFQDHCSICFSFLIIF